MKLRQGEHVVPITIAKVAPTPKSSAKSKTKGRGHLTEVPSGTSVPFYFNIESWPTGVSSLTATARCFLVNSITNTTSAGGVTTTGSPLSVFSGGTATYYNVTLTPGATAQINVTCPSTTAGKGVILVLTGSAESDLGDIFDFAGGNIFVVNP